MSGVRIVTKNKKSPSKLFAVSSQYRSLRVLDLNYENRTENPRETSHQDEPYEYKHNHNNSAETDNSHVPQEIQYQSHPKIAAAMKISNLRRSNMGFNRAVEETI